MPIVGAACTFDRSQRSALIQQLPDDAAAVVRGLCLLPLRPGALAALTVRDFDVRKHELRVLTDKAGEDRHILLPPATTAPSSHEVDAQETAGGSAVRAVRVEALEQGRMEETD